MGSVLVLCFLLSLLGQSVDSGGLQLSHQARALQPGEVVLITLRNVPPWAEPGGAAFKRTLRFYPGEEEGVFHALVGLDLETTPGTYSVEVLVSGKNGQKARATHQLRVSEKKFPTRHLTVSEKYVTPPAAQLERIRLETEELKRIFARSSSERLWEGQFLRPVPGPVISAFGKRSVLNGHPRSPHSGVDLRAASGTPLRTPAGGEVMLAKELYFAGKAVIVDHGLGLYSMFAHLSNFKVKVGDRLEKGQVIGLTGMTGRVSGPHLHWSVRLENSRVDPVSLLALIQ